MDDLPLFWEQTVNRRAAQFIVARTHATGRLVQRDVKLPFRANGFSINRNLVVNRINLRSEQADELAVDADFAVQNDLLRRAARSHACVRQKFLKSNTQFVASLNREPLNRLDDVTIQPLNGLRVWLGFTETRDAVAGLPLAALFEKFGALETLEDIALAAQR
jgi:hypothetical protein